jgi:ribosome-associated translation inhibitor RaiA
MRRTEPIAPPEVRISISGEVPEGTSDYARDKIAKAARIAHDPVLDARIRITVHPDPAVQPAVTAQVNLDVNGRMVHVQIEAPTVREAVDLLEARLRTRLDRAARHWEARRGGLPTGEPHEWRHQSVPTSRPAPVPPDPADRQATDHRPAEAPGSTVHEGW